MAEVGIFRGGTPVKGVTVGGREAEVWVTHPTTGTFTRVHPVNVFGEYTGPTRVLRNGKPLREMTPEQLSVWLTAGDAGGTALINAMLKTALGNLVGYSSYTASPVTNSTHLSLYREVRAGYEKGHRTPAYREFQEQFPAFVTAYEEGTL